MRPVVLEAVVGTVEGMADNLFTAAAWLAAELADDLELLHSTAVPVAVDVRGSRQVWHIDRVAAGWSDPCSGLETGRDAHGRRSVSRTATHRQVTMAELSRPATTDANPCTTCFGWGILSNVGNLLYQLLRVRNVLADVTGKKSMAPVNALPLLNSLREADTKLATAAAQTTSPAADTFATRLREELGVHITRFDDMVNGTKARDHTLRRVRKEHSGFRDDVDGIVLDEYPTLIGFTSVERQWPDLAKTVIGQFALRSDDDGIVVCLVPRYIADYLREVRPTKERRPAPAAALGTASTEAAQMAATIWEPTGPGPCRTLSGALQMATLTL